MTCCSTKDKCFLKTKCGGGKQCSKGQKSKKNTGIKTVKKVTIKKKVNKPTKKCACPLPGCPSNSPRVEVQVVSIDFNATPPAKARFTLGKRFKKQKIKIKATIFQGTVETVKKFKRTTNCSGDFSFPILGNTTDLEATVTVQIPSACSCTAHPCCVKAPYTGGAYGYDLIWRSYDGSANNLYHPGWGMAHTALLRKADSAYDDGSSTLAVRGPNNPSPREVSNAVCAQSVSNPNSLNLSAMTWLWGQFLDHEIDLTTTQSGGETANISTGATGADPNEIYPNRTILFDRSQFIVGSDPREQPNTISAWIDGTNVYGYSSLRSHALRLLDGTGKLKTGTADNGEVILPYNVGELSNAPSTSSSFFIAGDIRANENVALTAMHTLFVREHNRLCDEIVTNNPSWAGQEEMIYQQARRIVGGIMQQITYGEFLPYLLGENAFPAYTQYDSSIDGQIATEFSTAGYRFGHSMLEDNIKVGTSSSIPLKDGFFNPSYVQTNGIEALLHGASLQIQEEIDLHIVDAVRNFLFGPPTSTNLLDLAALNIQRGRDHGIPGYNAVRVAYGLPAVTTFAEITSDVSLQGKLATLYISPDHIDPWVGCLAEDHLTGLAVGPLIYAILHDQFLRLRNGDRFWFEIDPYLDDATKDEIRATRLSDVIIRNTDLTSAEIATDVFHVV